MTGEGPQDGRSAARWTEREAAGAEARISTAVAEAWGWCHVDRTDALAQGDGAPAATILERACVRGQRVRDGLAAERCAATPGGELGASAARAMRFASLIERLTPPGPNAEPGAVVDAWQDYVEARDGSEAEAALVALIWGAGQDGDDAERDSARVVRTFRVGVTRHFRRLDYFDQRGADAEEAADLLRGALLGGRAVDPEYRGALVEEPVFTINRDDVEELNE